MEKQIELLKKEILIISIIIAFGFILSLFTASLKVIGEYLLILLFNLPFLNIIYIGINNRKKYAGICGIVYGILSIFFLNLQIVFGIVILIHSIIYLKNYKISKK